MSHLPQQSETPGQRIRKKFLKSKPALVGLIFIVFCVFLSVFGYLFFPDHTPSCNDGAIEIRKKAPMTEVNILRIRKNQKVEKNNAFVAVFIGQVSEYNIKPIEPNYSFSGDYLIYSIIGSEGSMIDSVHIVDVVYPLMGNEKGNVVSDIERVKNTYSFRTIDQNLLTVDKEDLIEELKNQNIELRTYVLGTDPLGRDLLSRLLAGTRISLTIGGIAVFISLFIGLTLGAIAGFFRGKIDQVIMWFTTVFWSIPGIMLVIAISMAINSKGVWVAFVAVGLTMWVDVARVVRGQILEVREKLFVEAARAMGFSNWRIITRHILPSIVGPLIVVCTANFASAILVEAGLSFLGLGVQPPTPSWGSMVHDGFKLIGSDHALHLILYPGISISLLVLSFNLVGNGLRDAISPDKL